MAERSRSSMTDYEGMMMLEPRDAYDGCILGVVSRFGQDDVICYDLQAVLRVLQSDGMDGEGAREFFDFNILGAYVGSGTPCFLDGVTYLEVGNV